MGILTIFVYGLSGVLFALDYDHEAAHILILANAILLHDMLTIKMHSIANNLKSQIDSTSYDDTKIESESVL